MGSIINTIMNNDLLFYGIIVFLIVGVIILFMYLHHKKIIGLIEEEIEYTKVEDEKINDSIKTFADELKLNDAKVEIDNKIDELDGKLAMEKILKEEDKEQLPKVENNTVSKIDNTEKTEEVKKDNITKIQDDSKEEKSELELMLEKMQHDLEEQKDKDAVAIFEQEQEEKSIISYKELLNKKNELLNTDVFNDERFENEPIYNENSIDDKSLSQVVIEKTESINDNISVDAVKDKSVSENKKFKTTEFISPVFGRREAKLDYPKVPNFKEMLLKKEKTNEYDLEATLNLDPLTDEIKRDDAFLSALKEFRKNLE